MVCYYYFISCSYFAKGQTFDLIWLIYYLQILVFVANCFIACPCEHNTWRYRFYSNWLPMCMSLPVTLCLFKSMSSLSFLPPSLPIPPSFPLLLSLFLSSSSLPHSHAFSLPPSSSLIYSPLIYLLSLSPFYTKYQLSPSLTYCNVICNPTSCCHGVLHSL